MPSADLYQLIPPPLDDSSTMANWQISPGNAHPPSRLCPPHLRTCSPYRYWTLKILAFSSSTSASYAIPVRRASALPAASFRFHLAMDTLAVRLTIPPVGFVENFHLQMGAPCRAHKMSACGRHAVTVVPAFHEKANISQATWCVLSILHSDPTSAIRRGGTGFAGFHSHSWWSLFPSGPVHAGVRLSRGAATSVAT
jgi:hypothetical protein